MTLPTDPFFYACAILAVLVTGISKSGFGGATGGLGVVLLAQVMSPATAAAVMLPLLCLMDLFGVKAYWKAIDWAVLKRMLPSAVAGTLLGALLWSRTNVHGLKMLLAAVAIVFPLHWWWQAWHGHVGATPLLKNDRLRAAGWCSLAGFTSFVAHAGGPPLLAYVLPLQLHKTVQVGTMSFFFLVVNYAKVPQYIAVGQFTPEVLWLALLCAPLVPVGVWLGLKLHHALSPQAFTRSGQVLMFLMGWKLAVEAWQGLAP